MTSVKDRIERNVKLTWSLASTYVKKICHHFPPLNCASDPVVAVSDLEADCFLCHQGLQPPRHPSSPRTLKALTLTLTRCLATTPMPTTWTLQVSFVLLFPFHCKTSLALPPPGHHQLSLLHFDWVDHLFCAVHAVNEGLIKTRDETHVDILLQ